MEFLISELESLADLYFRREGSSKKLLQRIESMRTEAAVERLGQVNPVGHFLRSILSRTHCNDNLWSIHHGVRLNIDIKIKVRLTGK